ncbi:ABC transporter C family member 10-like [Triticum aestivum]|uniref:ABC transporter C family member 10-like n=1 Tax=Triticum aestivum TaxID=4565 RepID=UPI001D00AC1C|nr:ABC transporter C family member 10-like [Triticum aestivum]
MFDSSTCTNHLVATGIAALLGFVLALQVLVKIPQSRAAARQLVSLSSPLHLAAVAFSACLGLVYLGLGMWMLGSNFSQDAFAVYLPHWWLITLSQGLNLILTSLAFSIRPRFLGAAFVWFWPVLLTVYAAFVCSSSVVVIVAEKMITVKGCLDVLYLQGEVVLLIYGVRHSHDEEGYGGIGNGLYKPLDTEETDGEAADSEAHQVTPFATAGFFSEMSFWWLNPLIKMAAQP